MKVKDVLEHFLSRAPWVDRQNTVDRVIAGEAETEVDRCLVTWIPSFKALRRMVEQDVRLLICHEPTFWDHWDKLPADDAGVQAKLKFIQDHGLVVVRNHDCWDLWPEVGIPWAWARFLGFEGQPTAVSSGRMQHRYDIAPAPLGVFARQVAERCARIGEPFVDVTGDLSQVVSRIGIGTGCGCDIPIFQQIGCDCSIVCDDGSTTWAGIQRADDFGHPVIRVNHGTSEEPGMVTLTEYINAHLVGLRAEHLPHGNTFQMVGMG